MCNLKTLHFEVSQMTKVYNINAEFIMLSFNYLFMVQKLLGEGGGKQGDRERERERERVYPIKHDTFLVCCPSKI